MKPLPSRYEWFLARKLLMRAHWQRFIPLVAALSVGGVAIGVAALIIVLSVMNGFERDWREKITAMSAHLWVQPFSPAAPAAQEELLARVRAFPRVLGTGRYITSQALLQSAGGATGAVLFGLDADSAGNVVMMSDHVKAGSLPDFDSAEPAVMLGADLAASLKILPGESLVLLTGTQAAAGLPRILRAKVSGIFEVGMYDYDAHMAYLPLASLQRLLGKSGTPGLLVRVDDVMRAHDIGRELGANVGPGYIVRDWLSLNRNLFYAIKIEKIVMFVILLMIVAVAAFNITSSLIMTVMEKTRAIGILKAVGVPPRRLGMIFVLQGTVVGAAGVTAGVLLGLAVCAFISVYPLKLPGGGSVYYLTTLPVQMNLWRDLLIIPGSALALCVLSALYPARQAAKLDPMEAIRYE